MKKWVKLTLGGVAIIILLFLVWIIYVAVDELKQEALLKIEILNFSNKDLMNDEFKIEIKTKGDCAYVEETIKKYYKRLSDSVKNINKYLADEKLNNVLAPSSLSLDRPNYNVSRETIRNSKDSINKYFKEIDSSCDGETIKSLLDKDKLDDYEYYYDLYLQIMYTEKDKEEYKKLRKDMGNTISTFNEFLDKALEIVDFLENNDSVIEYTNSVVYFNSDSALNEYNKLLEELHLISNKFTIGNDNVKKENDDLDKV